MDKTVGSVMNGDGSSPETDMFAKYPVTPSDSVPNTPGRPHRRIRCKMCRQELATREHMLDHGQLGPATPADSPADSRRPSRALPRRPSGESARRRPSRLSFSSKFGESLSMTSIEPTNGSTVHPLHTLRNMSHTSTDTTSALEIEDESETELNAFPANSSSEVTKSGDATEGASLPVESPPTTHFINPSDLSSQLFANPALAVLRSANSAVSPNSINSPPILLNTKCSGYFVEPMKWMDHFLSGGQLAGKITCPNMKCTAKLGNYDWAGVCCGCKQWVTPGFCINRSKVDEVV